MLLFMLSDATVVVYWASAGNSFTRWTNAIVVVKLLKKTDSKRPQQRHVTTPREHSGNTMTTRKTDQ